LEPFARAFKLSDCVAEIADLMVGNREVALIVGAIGLGLCR
jgi:hypothetical protein